MSHAEWRAWLAALPARTYRPALDLSARARTAPTALLGYSLSVPIARSLTGYDDAQLTMADALLHGRRAAQGMPSVPHAWRLAPGDPHSLLPRVLGEEPFCALAALLAEARFGLTMADLRVVTFYPTHRGLLAACGVAFVVVAPGMARFFDHEGQIRGRELDAVAAFIHARRDTVALIDALAPTRERLLGFDDCNGPTAVRERLLALCRSVSDGFRRPAATPAHGAGGTEPDTRVIVSSREAGFGIPGQLLYFPSLASRRALHRLPDRSLLWPREWPRGDAPAARDQAPVANAAVDEAAHEVAHEVADGAAHGAGHAAAHDAAVRAARRRLTLQKDQIAAFGFADLGLRSPLLPACPTPPQRSRPGVLPSIHDALRHAARPFLGSLDDTAHHARRARAAGIAGPRAPDWLGLEAFARQTAAGVRTLMATLEECGARGDVTALRVCLGVLRRLEGPLLSALGAETDLCALAMLARWRLEDAETALALVADGESPAMDAAAAASARHPRALDDVCAALYPRGVAAVGSALCAVARAGDAMTRAPFGDLVQAVRALHAASPVAHGRDAPAGDAACAREVVLANIDIWLEDAYDLLFLRTPDAARRALFAVRRIGDATRVLGDTGPAATAVLAAAGAVTQLLEPAVAP